MFKEYLLLRHKDRLLNILQDKEENKQFSLDINFVALFEEDPALGNLILSNPEEILKTCDETILEVQQMLINNVECDYSLIPKQNIHSRIYGLPSCPELHKVIFPKNEDLGLFLQVSGTVVRMTAVKMLEHIRDYMCTKCRYKMAVEGKFEQKYTIFPPKRCANPEFCKSTNIIVNSTLDGEHCRDYQEVKIQEQVSKLEIGSMPNTMWITLEDDLVDVCKPGDSVTICGVVKRRWKSPAVGRKLDVDLVLKTNHIQVNNDTSSTISITSDMKDQFDSFWENHKNYPLHGRDLILRSFCPQIYGMYVVKLAVATILAGGSTFHKNKDTGIRTRTEPHLLLVGDPGTGKSQMLRYAAKIIPRSILTTGVGSTSAGLTVAAVMEDGEWQLEGGALVLADGGICCIDEFNSMKEHDRTSIHEAMEQQTISVAKASIVCKLSTRCSILAATNPKGPLNPSNPLSMNVALASPLLSRFDLILFLKDEVNAVWDEKVADYILRGYKRKSKFFDDKYTIWSMEMLQAYFLLIKKLNPTLTPKSKQVLGAYYQLQRKAATRDKARTTVRLLDSLVRLSQAHARLMCHKEVEIMDAVTAISLVEVSMQGDACMLLLDFDAHTDFLDDSMESYEKLVHVVLEKLELYEVLESEIAMLRSHEIDANGLQSEDQRDRKKNTGAINVEVEKQRNIINVTVSQIAKSVGNATSSKVEIEHSRNVQISAGGNNNTSNLQTVDTLRKCIFNRPSDDIIENCTTFKEQITKSKSSNEQLAFEKVDLISSTQFPVSNNEETEKKRKFVDDADDYELINLIPSGINSHDINEAFDYIEEISIPQNEAIDEVNETNTKFIKESVKSDLAFRKYNSSSLKVHKSTKSNISFNKTDSGNFSIDSQTINIFECQNDDFSELELDI